MHCHNCNFVFRGEAEVCPYCGAPLVKQEPNWLLRHIPLSHDSEITIGFIFCVLLVNLFLACLVFDLITNFSCDLTFFGYVGIIGSVFFVLIVMRAKRWLTITRGVDIFFLIGLVVFLLVFGEYGGRHSVGGNNAAASFALEYVFPAYLVFVTGYEWIFLMTNRNVNSSQLIGDALFRFLIATLIFAFLFSGLDAYWYGELRPYSSYFVSIAFGVTLSFFITCLILVFRRLFRQLSQWYVK